MRSFWKSVALTVLALGVFSGGVIAAPIPIANGSFEEGENGHTAISGWSIPGWNLDNLGGLFGKSDLTSVIGTQFQTKCDGNCAGLFNSFFEITQLTPGVITEGLTYRLQFSLSQRIDFANNWSTFRARIYGKGPSDPAPIYITHLDVPASAVPLGRWATFVLTYTADNPAMYGKNIFIKLENTGGGLQPWIDDVRLSDSRPTAPTFGITVPLINASFEDGDDGHTAIGGWSIPGWTSGSTGLFGKRDISASIPEQFSEKCAGNCAAFFNEAGSISQVTSAVITEGTTYLLNVSLSQRKDFANTWAKFKIYIYGKGASDAEPVYIASLDIPASEVPSGTWKAFTLKYTANNPAMYGKNIVTQLQNADAGLQPWFDAVELKYLRSINPIEIQNPSFEDGDDGYSLIGGWELPGWELGSLGGLVGKSNRSAEVGTQFNSIPDGVCMGFINGGFEIMQLTPGVLEEGNTYVLQVDLGQRMDFTDTWTKFNLAMYALGTEDWYPIYLSGIQYDISGVPQGGWLTAELAYTANNPDVFGKNIYIKLENGAGLQPWFDNVRLGYYAPPAAGAVEIAAAKKLANGTPVSCTGTVTAVFDGYFYIETADRTNGIRVVNAASGALVGNSATVVGPMATLATGERCIEATSVTTVSGTPLAPLGMTNKSVGGGGVPGGVGVDNVGLLVKTTGTVVAIDSAVPAKWFTLDDGSGVPLQVDVPPGINTVAFGNYVAVKGITSCGNINGYSGVRRKILVNANTDVQKLK